MVWLLPGSETILVTDQTGGVPVEACNWHESVIDDLKKRLGEDYGSHSFDGYDSWTNAVTKAQAMQKKLGWPWQIQYDNWYGHSAGICERIPRLHKLMPG